MTGVLDTVVKQVDDIEDILVEHAERLDKIEEDSRNHTKRVERLENALGLVLAYAQNVLKEERRQGNGSQR